MPKRQRNFSTRPCSVNQRVYKKTKMDLQSLSEDLQNKINGEDSNNLDNSWSFDIKENLVKSEEYDPVILDIGDSSNSSSYFNSEFKDVSYKLSTNIRHWSMKANIRHSSLSELLQILREHHPALPDSAKTLLQPNMEYQVNMLKNEAPPPPENLNCHEPVRTVQVPLVIASASRRNHSSPPKRSHSDEVDSTIALSKNNQPTLSSKMSFSEVDLDAARSRTNQSMSLKSGHNDNFDCGCFRDKLDAIVTKLNSIEDKLDMLMKQQHKTTNEIKTESIAVPNKVVIPMSNDEEWKQFENILKENSNKKQMIMYIKSLMKENLTRSVCSIMESLMTNNFAKQFNWVGANSKKSLKSSTLARVVCDAVLEVGIETSKEKIEEKIRSWVKQAFDRDGGRKRRAFRNSDKNSDSSHGEF